MDRIEMITADGNCSAEVKMLFEGVASMLGRVPNSYRVLGRVP